MTFREFMRENGYELQTTFWEDFSIADRFGLSAIQDTFKRAFEEWKNNYKYLTELILVNEQGTAFLYIMQKRIKICRL